MGGGVRVRVRMEEERRTLNCHRSHALQQNNQSVDLKRTSRETLAAAVAVAAAVAAAFGLLSFWAVILLSSPPHSFFTYT
ncbi:hypothetical protein E2C01_037428 [Portunus trituberculatus]|uniref:Uncharacterized protein n=1 Tax=Portunus trituberculatus TaxID=210409 RepID=A0A5B7FEK8_PORTR|nr:hypothetical protein [Portunus trituberculatus]